MRRSSRYKTASLCKKGQWMLISAVIVTSSFLAISLVLKDFFLIDSSVQARNRVDIYFQNIKEQFEQVVDKSSCGPGGSNMEKNLNDYIAFAKKKLWESGYLVHIEYERTPLKIQGYTFVCTDTPRARDIGKGIIVATEGSVYYSGLSSAQVRNFIGGS